MNIILVILSSMCLLYFLVLLGVGMDFSFVWLLGALFFGGLFCIRIYLSAHSILIGKGIRCVATAVFVVLVLIFGIAEAFIISGMHEMPGERLDYLIVLGAQVRGNTPSKALNLRLDMAEKIWHRCGEPVLLLSGGKGTGEEISEAECMRRVLLEKGIPEDKLVLEDRSVSTVENLKFCAELLDCKTARTGIVTNNFHVFRAMRLAKKLGYEQVYGAAAKSDWRYQIHYMVREAFALIKELVSGNI